MCECPLDWVACFRQDCERAAWLRQQWELRVQEARRLLGDPSKVVTWPDNQ
jgi:hypothetical protein